MVEEVSRQRVGTVLEREGLQPFRETLKAVEAVGSDESIPTDTLQSLANSAIQLRNVGHQVTSEVAQFQQDRDATSMDSLLRTQFGTQLRHGLEQNADLEKACSLVFHCAVGAVENVQRRRSTANEPWWDVAVLGNPSRALLRSTRAWFRVSMKGPVLWRASADEEEEEEESDAEGGDEEDMLRLSLCQRFFASLHECGLIRNQTGVTNAIFGAAVSRTRRHVSTVVPGRCDTSCDGAIRRWQAVVLAPVLALLFCQAAPHATGEASGERGDLHDGSIAPPDGMLLRWVARDLQSTAPPTTTAASSFDEFDVGVPQRPAVDPSGTTHRRPPATEPSSSSETSDHSLWRLSALWIVTLRAERDTSLVETHTSQLFDLIRDDPDTIPAQRDLSAALERVGGHQHHHGLVRRLQDDFRRRLMHPGVATKDLLHMFVSSVRVLQRLDPEGVVVEAALVPLQRYVRKRSDALQCIVRGLTAGKVDGGLAAELARRSGRVVRVDAGSDSETERESDEEEEVEGGAGQDGEKPASDDGSELGWDDDDDDEDEEGEQRQQHQQSTSDRRMTATASKHASKRAKRELWRPLARDTPVDYSGMGRADLLSLLVSIFQRVDVVAQEYAQLLSVRLLEKLEFDIEHETRIHEMMKLRLGEGPLHMAEVMLKDIVDSKRFRTHVASHRGPVMTLHDSIRRVDGPSAMAAAQVLSTFGRASSLDLPSTQEGQDEWPLPHAKLLSYLFWPGIEAPVGAEGPWKHLHPAIQARLETYTKEFATLKRPRTLRWLAQLGTMNLELTAANGTQHELTLSLLEASTALHLGNQGRWTAEELCAVLDAEWADVYRWLRPLLVNVRRNGPFLESFDTISDSNASLCSLNGALSRAANCVYLDRGRWSGRQLGANNHFHRTTLIISALSSRSLSATSLA